MTRARILVIDDEVGSTRLLKENLEMTNRYEVWVENQPENALAAARQFRPHLVLLDFVMPHMSGAEVAKALRNEPELQSVRIAIMTAADKSRFPTDTDPALQHLPRIAKPAHMEEILRFLESTLPPLPIPGLIAPGNPAQPMKQNQCRPNSPVLRDLRSSYSEGIEERRRKRV